MLAFAIVSAVFLPAIIPVDAVTPNKESAEYKQMISKHVVDRLIRFDAMKHIETDERFQRYFKDIIAALQGIMDGHLLCPERTIEPMEEKYECSDFK